MDDNIERWRGVVDYALTSLKEDLASIILRHEKLDAKEQLLELKVQTIATRIGLYASLGAFLGGGIISIVIALFFHK